MRYTDNQLRWLVTRKHRELAQTAMLGLAVSPVLSAYLTIVLDVHPPLHDDEARAIMAAYNRAVDRGAHPTH